MTGGKIKYINREKTSNDYLLILALCDFFLFIYLLMICPIKIGIFFPINYFEMRYLFLCIFPTILVMIKNN